jgi:hypothetical protein
MRCFSGEVNNAPRRCENRAFVVIAIQAPSRLQRSSTCQGTLSRTFQTRQGHVLLTFSTAVSGYFSCRSRSSSLSESDCLSTYQVPANSTIQPSAYRRKSVPCRSSHKFKQDSRLLQHQIGFRKNIANLWGFSRLKLHHMASKEDHAPCKRHRQSLGL